MWLWLPNHLAPKVQTSHMGCPRILRLRYALTDKRHTLIKRSHRWIRIKNMGKFPNQDCNNKKQLFQTPGVFDAGPTLFRFAVDGAGA
jgi:hypothetical protein